MKTKVYRYANLVSTLLTSVFILMKWFTISAMGTVEAHSFMTIPGMLNDGAAFLTQIGGKSVAITVLILSGILEYMCILVSAIGIWGVWRSFRYNKKSRLVFTSQIIALALSTIAIITICIVSYVSATMLGNAVSVVPTVWLIIAVLSLAVSLTTGALYNKSVEYDYEDEVEDEVEV